MGGMDEHESEIVRREAARHGMTETQYRMWKVAPTDLVQSIVWDNIGRPDVLKPRSIAATPEQRAEHRGTGWVDPKPLEKQPGIDLIGHKADAGTLQRMITEPTLAIEAKGYDGA